MTIRTRKLIGTVLFAAFSVIYFFIAITIALARLPETSIWTQLLFYLVTTVIWCLISGVIIRWMLKQPQPAG